MSNRGIPSEALVSARNALKSSYSVAASQLAKLALQVVSVLVLTRLFDPTDFGILALATLAVLVAELMRDQGMTVVLLSDNTVSQNQLHHFGIRQLYISCSSFVSMCAIGWLLQVQGNYKDAIISFSLMGLIPLFSALQMPSSIQLNKEGKFRVQNFAEILGYGLSFLIALLAAILGFGILALILQPVTNSAINSGIRMGAAPWPVFKHKPQAEIRNLQKRGKHILVSNFITLTASNADSASLALRSNPMQLGGYNRLYQVVVGSAAQLINSLGPLILATLGKLGKDYKSSIRFLDFFVYRLGLVSAMAVGLIIPYSEVFVSIIFGLQWLPFHNVLVFLSISAVLQVMTYTSYWAASAILPGKEILRLSLMTKVPSAILIAIGSTYGPDGVSICLAISLLYSWIVFSRKISKATNRKFGEVTRSGALVLIVLLLSCGLNYLISISVNGVAGLGCSLLFTFALLVAQFLFLMQRGKN